MNAYGYIYKTTNLVNGNIYIGQHKGEFTEKYLGSGVYLQRSVRKYGHSFFKVIPLCFASNSDALNSLEVFWIESYRKSIKDIVLYNLAPGGNNGGVMSDRVKENRRPKISGENHWTRKHPERLSGENNPMWGRKHSEKTKSLIAAKRLGKQGNALGIIRSEEQKRKISETKKIRYANGEVKHPMLGKHHSSETREKIRSKHLGLHPSIETRIKMSKSSKGKPKSKEMRRRLSEYHKKLWRDKK